jgi:hypothetical protein
VTNPRNEWAALEGKYFISFCEGGRHRYAGVVLAQVFPGCYMVEYGSWLTGTADFYGHQLVAVNDMLRQRWAFYNSAQALEEAVRYGGREHRGGASCICTEIQRRRERRLIAEEAGPPIEPELLQPDDSDEVPFGD